MRRFRSFDPARRCAARLLAALSLAACAGVPTGQGDFNAAALAESMGRQPVVLLGEVHDNVVQHRVRAQALRLLLQSGARPALAFEQFDRGQQSEVDRIRSQAHASTRERVDQLVAVGAKGWDWALYRPFLELALEFDLPVVAADLSRSDAMRVSQQGYGAAFSEQERERLGLDRIPDAVLQAQEEEVDAGHCHRIPPAMLPAIARAQIGRDAALALALMPYLQRGVVLLSGNGHVRRDIGVPRYLPAQEAQRVISIGLLEADADPAPPGAYDVVFRTRVQYRPDPCKTLKFNALNPDPSPAPGAGRKS